MPSTSVDRIPISSWTPGQTTAADLEKTTLEFRHRLVRAAEAPPKPQGFQGGKHRGIQPVAELVRVRTIDDQIQILTNSATNAGNHHLGRPAPKPLKCNLRLEPAATTDPHGKSIQLPSFEATNEWRTHSVKLSTAPKQEVFLGHINSAYTNRLQITFDFANQQDLLAGDMILLDDVKFLSQ